MAIQFPSSPTLNQTYTYNSITWTYNGKGWTKSSGSGGASLPTQTNNSGKFLTTDGTSPSWGTVTAPTPAAVSDQSNSSTGYFDLPSGTTAERPATAYQGATRINTTTNYLEIYHNGTWNNLNYIGGVVASGGTITTSGSYKIHKFTSSGTFTVAEAPPNSSIEYMIIGGGGGGGVLGGGGGGGGYLAGTIFPSATAYSIVVGAGANGGAGGTPGGTGSNTTAFGLTAFGGGGGGSHSNGSSSTSGTAGGSGGGGADNETSGGNGTTGQGYAGGTGRPGISDPRNGGGGGGAGGVGATGSTTGAGGPGAENSILGVSYYWAGGGGCSGYGGSSFGGNGGIGGGGGGSTNGSGALGVGGTSALNAGGNGSRGDALMGGLGGANTGGGGGGNTWMINATSTANGGSGIVVIRYKF